MKKKGGEGIRAKRDKVNGKRWNGMKIVWAYKRNGEGNGVK
jgi:hypothetical protein